VPEKDWTPAQIYGRLPPKPGKRPRGRPRLEDAEKARRETLKPCRMGPKPGPEPLETLVAPRAYLALADDYSRRVADGTIVACSWVRLACARQGRDRARAAADPAWPFVWSDAAAIEACTFLERLPHTEGTWTTPLIELAPWQVFVVSTLFGWRRRDDPARRRFTSLYLELGRKGAKSTLLAGILLYHVCCEHEPGAMGVCGATTGQQARIVFSIAQRMVRRSPWLRETYGLQAFANAIISDEATIKPINAKASTQDGLNPSCIVLDESHAQSFALHDVLKSSQGARRNPLIACPTTAGYDLLSVGYALRTAAIKMLEGVLEADHLLGLVYTLDEGDDWRDARTWIKANPMIGITPSYEWVRSYCADAQATPGLEGEFRVKVCSEWANAASTWLSVAAWDRCADPTLTLESFAGQRCWIGGDLAQLDDLAAIALVFERGGLVYVFVRFYLPRAVVAARSRAVPQYRAWADNGELVLTDGDMIDYGRIEADVRASCKQFNVAALRFDQFGSAGIVSALAGDGFPAAILDKNRKTMTPPARDLETRVRHGKIRHAGSACLRWQVSNAVVTRGVDDTLLPKKDNPDSPHKIDGIDAILQALSAWLTPAERPREYQMLVLGGSR
jgi:phage terminase large subunit-like protein